MACLLLTYEAAKSFCVRHCRYISLVILCRIISLIAFAEQGTSRGGADIRRIVQRLSLWGISMLFVVGGNGVNPITF